MKSTKTNFAISLNKCKTQKLMHILPITAMFHSNEWTDDERMNNILDFGDFFVYDFIY